MTKPLVKSKCELCFIYLSAVSFSPSQQSTKHSDDFLLLGNHLNSGCQTKTLWNRAVPKFSCLNSNHKIELKRVFKNQTVLSKMSPLCCSERVKAKSSKFFLQEAVLGRRLLQVGGCKCRRNRDARGNRPLRFWQESKENLLHQNTLDYYWSTRIFRPSYGPVPLTACEQGCFDTFECMSFLIALLIQPT